MQSPHHAANRVKRSPLLPFPPCTASSSHPAVSHGPSVGLSHPAQLPGFGRDERLRFGPAATQSSPERHCSATRTDSCSVSVLAVTRSDPERHCSASRVRIPWSPRSSRLRRVARSATAHRPTAYAHGPTSRRIPRLLRHYSLARPGQTVAFYMPSRPALLSTHHPFSAPRREVCRTGPRVTPMQYHLLGRLLVCPHTDISFGAKDAVS